MKSSDYYTYEELEQKAKALFAEERAMKRLDGWFLAREIAEKSDRENPELSRERRASAFLKRAAAELPLQLSENAVFAGTQRDAFARSYALINPNFKVASFNGYCDPTAVFQDIEPNEEFPAERIETLRRSYENTDYVRTLKEVYASAELDTSEVAYFIEQVTGHVIPDFRPALAHGVQALIAQLDENIANSSDKKRIDNWLAMKETLEGAVILAHRYADLAHSQMEGASPARRAQLELLENALRRVPQYGAETLFEAIQSFLLLWQLMCLEQAPNPFALSVGNADRIFEPYRRAEGLSRQEAAGLFEHFLMFFNVGDRSWAISQNVLISGRDLDGNDLTNETSYALLDAYFAMNFPQPILSVKLHKNTPVRLQRELGRFLFTPGCLTPSFFNDDALFVTLEKGGIAREDLPDYSVAGCQEPLIMGKDNGNTTNSWLNLGKILELTLHDGISAISGKRLAPASGKSFEEILATLKESFFERVEFYLDRMANAANGASRAISCLPVPFLSTFMGGISSGIDMRDTEEQGTRYNASGCLIHGLSVVADSFVAVSCLLRDRPQDTARLKHALETNFSDDPELREYLRSCPKYGNNLEQPDKEAVEIAKRVSDMVHNRKNYLGNRFRADWSTPSTHLLYGYWVGATPDGRKSRDMLNYGVDPLYGEASQGLGFRCLSVMKLPYELFDGGYASHFGIDPKYFTAQSLEERGEQFFHRIMEPLFFNPGNQNLSPSYLYVNVTTPEILRMVLKNPKKYAPSGVYIMRIHGTFVNFLDLSPEIQQDIITRLDPQSTAC